jgi:hypothetical protein
MYKHNISHDVCRSSRLILFQDELNDIGATDEKWHEWQIDKEEGKTDLEIYLKECRDSKQLKKYMK